MRIFRQVSRTTPTSAPVAHAVPAGFDSTPKNTIGRQVFPSGDEVMSDGVATGGSPNGKIDVTSFEAWEIEFLSAKVYSYVKRKLETEMERHGRTSSSLWP